MCKNFYCALFFCFSLLCLTSVPLHAQMPGSGTRSCQEDSRISVAFTGATSITTCTNDDVNDRIRFQVVDFRQAFAYVVVDANDIILSIGFDNFINFDMLPPGTLRVYAFSTYGRITASVGDVFSTAVLSTPCFGLTENFVTVFNGQVGGNTATISTADGQTEYTFCPGDGQDDIVSVQATADVDDVTFVVTDENSIVLDLTTDTEINFDGAPLGVCRIYAFAGFPPFVVGEDISGFEPSDCSGTLSDNFITVTRVLLIGGTVTTAGGATELLICPQDGNADAFDFVTTGNSGTTTRYLVTDENNVLIGLPAQNIVDFDNAPPGTCRVWSVSYEGDLLVTLGTDLDGATLASGCFVLSDNFVEVVRRIPEAGTVATTDGATSLTTCPGDGQEDLVTVVTTGSSADNLAFVITDGDGNILAVQSSPTFNLEGAGVGACRIYAVSYQGTLNTDLSGPVAAATFSTGCNDLSDNFVTVTREVPDAGTITTADGETNVTLCPGDGIQDIIDFTVNGNDGEQTALIVTDDNNIIIGLPAGNTVDFQNAGLGICRVWSLSYRGDLIAEIGQNAATARLASDCFALSDNFVTVTRELLEGGTVTTEDGETDLLICPLDDMADVVTLVTTGNTGQNTRYLVTDVDNVVIFVPTGNTVDFNNALPGICRIWSVSYEGELIVGTGMDVDDTEVASGCFSISDNFVEVVRRIPAAGTIATIDGETEVTTCPGDGNDDIVTVRLTGNSADELAYVITDASDLILSVQTSPTFNLEGAGVGACRIYGIAYQGTLNTGVTGPVTGANFSDDCNDLTENAVVVTREVPSGGTVSTDDGQTSVAICPLDGNPDEITFTVSGNEGSQFTFVVTDENNVILGVPAGNVVDFEDAGFGVCRLWGLSYQGTLTAVEGQDFLAGQLATECFGRSENFVTVTRSQPEGGMVALSNGQSSATLCPGDGIADIVTFVSTGATGDNFLYIVTDDQGIILSFQENNSINFETVDPGVCLVYGLSYTGNITAQPGEQLTDNELTDGCFALSTNAVTINRIEASTGEISLEGGGTEITVCPGDFIPDAVAFDSTGTTLESFNYLVTDTNNMVIRVAFTDVINFETFPLGVCRVYGLGYNGIIMTGPGEIAGEDQLATECAALSPNFVTVIKERPDGGTITLADGTTEIVVCPMDGEPDLVTAVATGAEGSNFTFLLTTADNRVIAVREDGEFDFDNASLGSCRIWGLSYQGDLILQVGDDAATTQLASGCFDLSDNFVTVIREEVMGGTIALTDGETEITICPDDGQADLIELTSMGATGGNFLYVVTDDNNVILEVLDGNVADFDGAPEGICRVWGLSFFGVLTAGPGDRADLVDLASGCFALSENFVTVTRIQPVAGELTFTAAPLADTLQACSNDTINFELSEETRGDFAIAILDGDANLVGFIEGTEGRLAGLPTNVYQLVGLAYVGDLIAFPGEPFDLETVVVGCVEATNPLYLDLEAVDGGVVTSGGEDIVYLCPENLNDGLIELETTSTLSGENYVYVITTDTDGILDSTTSTTYDLSFLPLNEVRIYGISYTGDLLMPLTGRNVFLSDLATGCADVSTALRILNYDPAAGSISVDGLGSAGVACTVNGDENLSVTVTDASPAGYAILVTDLDSIVQLISFDPDSIPFGSLPEGDYLIFGLSYTGNVTVMPGDDLNTAILANNCFQLTEAAVAVTQGGPIEAGMINNLNGTSDTITFCTSDGGNQLVIADATVVGPNYRFLITDETGDIVVPNLQSGIIPFTALGDGTYRIYGFNFTGTNQAFFGRNVETDVLSTECAALTTNFLTVIKTAPSGGVVTTTDGATEVGVEIPEGGGLTEVDFVNTSDSVYQYFYLITDTSNVMLGLVDFTPIDFSAAGPGIYRVYGLEFLGDFIGEGGDTIDRVELATGCYGLSENFVTVTVTQEEGIVDDIDLNPGSDVELTASPNPTFGGTLTVRISSQTLLENGMITIRDVNGQLQQSRSMETTGNRTELRFDVGALSPGIYFLNYRTSTGNHTVRFVKQ